jgi:hypothetical protein
MGFDRSFVLQKQKQKQAFLSSGLFVRVRTAHGKSREFHGKK